MRFLVAFCLTLCVAKKMGNTAFSCDSFWSPQGSSKAARMFAEKTRNRFSLLLHTRCSDHYRHEMVRYLFEDHANAPLNGKSLVLN